MPNYPIRFAGSLDAATARDVRLRGVAPARVVRAVEHGQAVEHGRGLVQAARIRAMERVAEEALHATGRISQTEMFWVRHAPHAAGRVAAIADLAAMALADVVSELGRD